MRCEEAGRELHQARDPARILSRGLQAHLARCAGCRAVQGDLVRLRRGLRSLEAMPVPDDFELSLRRRLRQEAGAAIAAAGEAPSGVQRGSGTISRHRRWLMPLAAAAAVLLMVGILAGPRIQRWRGGGAGAESEARYLGLRVSIQVTEEQENALFDVRLPESIRLTAAAEAALGPGPVVRWRSRLRPGRNEIDLPLLARGPGSIRIELRSAGRFRSTVVPVSSKLARREASLLVAWTLPADSPREVPQ